MALITRITRLFTADFHAVLDRIEEPEILLKQALREMEEELAHGEQRVVLLHSEDKQLTAREADARDSLQDIEEELDVCFESGEEQLARAITRRKLETGRLAKTLATRRQRIRQTLDEQQHQLEENRARLVSMRQQADSLIAESPESRESAGDKPASIAGTFSVTDDEVEAAFLREKMRRTQ